MASSLPQLLKDICIIGDPKSTVIEIKEDSQITEPVFLRISLIFIKSIKNKTSSLFLSWLTISQCKVKFISIDFKCKIHSTAQSHIIAENCTFSPFDSKSECIIEIFANSKGTFKNCIFNQAFKTAVAVRDRSEATFINCTFDENENASILVMENSKTIIQNCTFNSANRFSVYLYRKAVSIIENSKFLSQKGKAVFMLSCCQAHVNKCTFNDCQGGGIAIADSSELFLSNSTFSDIKSSTVHAVKKSFAAVMKCTMSNCKGNGVNFEYSNGYVYGCKFLNFEYPPIVCFGLHSTPIIFNSKIINCKSIAIAARDCSSPLLSKLVLSNVESHGFSISDFANAVIENCKLQKIGKKTFCVFNGATATVINCVLKYDKTDNGNFLFQTFSEGAVNFNKNVIISEDSNLLMKVHNFGKIGSFSSNYFCLENNIQKNEYHLVTIDEINNVNIQADASLIDKNISFDVEELSTENISFDKEEEEINNNDDDDNENENEQIQQNQTDLINENQFHNETNHLNVHAYQTYPSLQHIKQVNKLDEIQPPSDMPSKLPEVNIDQIVSQIDSELADNDDNKAETMHHNCGICMKCGKNLADMYCIPCGHKVLCNECKPSEESSDNPFVNTCPLCETPICGCTVEYAEKQCVICLDHACDTIILPCGHRCMCYKCATQLWDEKRQCPLCQRKILSVRHLFKVYSNDEIKELEKKIFA